MGDCCEYDFSVFVKMLTSSLDVHGIMNGEVMRDFGTSGLELGEIEIC